MTRSSSALRWETASWRTVATGSWGPSPSCSTRRKASQRVLSPPREPSVWLRAHAYDYHLHGPKSRSETSGLSSDPERGKEYLRGAPAEVSLAHLGDLGDANAMTGNVPLLHQELLWSPGWLPSWLCVLNVHTILLVSRSTRSGRQMTVLLSSTDATTRGAPDCRWG